jgi:hypothetical protein
MKGRTSLWVPGLILTALGFNWSCLSSQRKDVLVIRNGIDVSYAGKHRDHQQIRQLFEDFPGIRRNVYHKIRRRTGLWPKDGSVIVVRLEDREWRHGKALAWMSPRTLNRRDGVLINYYTDGYLAMPGAVKDVLAHETIHAIMYQLMGARRFFSLPIWVREGSAGWGAGEVPMRLRGSVCHLKRSADEILDGLERREYEATFHQGQDYLEDALAFDYVARVQGMDKVRELYTHIAAGVNPELAFEKVTGLPWGEVKIRMDEFARRVIAEVDCTKKVQWSTGIKSLLRNERYIEARDQLQAFVEQYPQSPKAPLALLWLGRCQLALRSLPKALDAFENVLAHTRATNEQREQARKLADSIRRCLGNPTCATQNRPEVQLQMETPKVEEFQLDLVPPSEPQAPGDE